MKRLITAFKSGTVTKENINQRGYNKFLDITENVKVTINSEKIAEDQQWDGWKGYHSNTDLPARDVYDRYHDLWYIERAYRITKGKEHYNYQGKIATIGADDRADHATD